MVSVTPLRLTGRGWLPGPICVCPAFVGAPSSPRHFQQDLAATEEMLHRVLDMLEGVHARHGDNKGAVGHQRCRLTNDRHHLVAVVEVADKESADREVLADRAEWKPSRTAASGACAVRRRYSCRHREESAPLTAPSPVEPIPTIWRGCLGCWLRLTNAAHDRASCGVHEGTRKLHGTRVPTVVRSRRAAIEISEMAKRPRGGAIHRRVARAAAETTVDRPTRTMTATHCHPSRCEVVAVRAARRRRRLHPAAASAPQVRHGVIL